MRTAWIQQHTHTQYAVEARKNRKQNTNNEQVEFCEYTFVTYTSSSCVCLVVLCWRCCRWCCYCCVWCSCWCLCQHYMDDRLPFSHLIPLSLFIVLNTTHLTQGGKKNAKTAPYLPKATLSFFLSRFFIAVRLSISFFPSPYLSVSVSLILSEMYSVTVHTHPLCIYKLTRSTRKIVGYASYTNTYCMYSSILYAIHISERSCNPYIDTL